MFERSQRKHNSLGSYDFFGDIFPLIAKYFYQCVTLILKIGEDFIMMVRKAKGFELMKILFITHLNTFGLKVFLTLKIMDFESVALTKVVHIYVIEGMNA
jgi:hypothetical protein